MTTLIHKTITHLTFSPDGTELLVNMGGEQIYLYDINGARPAVVSVSQHSHFQKPISNLNIPPIIVPAIATV